MYPVNIITCKFVNDTSAMQMQENAHNHHDLSILLANGSTIVQLHVEEAPWSIKFGKML